MHGAQQRKTHWSRVRLYAADGYGLVSAWDHERRAAVQILGERMGISDEKTTAEHVRALAELRDCDTCANWFTDAELAGTGPRRDEIDWADFPDEAP